MRPALDARVSVASPFPPDDRPAVALVASACAGIIGLDPDLRITSWNAGAASLFRRAAGECIGVEFTTLLTRLAQQEWLEQTAPVRRGGGATFETTAAGPSGDTTDVTISLAPLEDAVSGTPGYVAVVQKSARGVLERTLIAAANRECQRIGQELHDHLCQHLLGAAFSAKALADGMARNGHSASELNELARMINSAVQDAREVVRGLNADDFGEAGFRAALEHLTRTPRHGISCRLECPPQISSQARRAAPHLYRIAQEALANAVAHSGASEVMITFTETAAGITLAIEDDGAGLPVALPADGPGLALMKAHARAAGATLSLHTRKKGGTCVSVLLAN